MFYGVWLMLLGVLAVPNLILGKKPELKPTLDKLTPFQGWIGVGAALSGLLGLVFSSLLGLAVLAVAPLWWITLTATNVVILCLGLLLGVGTMKTFVKDPAAQQKLDLTVTKIAPYQGMLGLAAIGLGVWTIIASFVVHH
jgi:ABC-type multidrug transport system permease subunit